MAHSVRSYTFGDAADSVYHWFGLTQSSKWHLARQYGTPALLLYLRCMRNEVTSIANEVVNNMMAMRSRHIGMWALIPAHTPRHDVSHLEPVCDRWGKTYYEHKEEHVDMGYILLQLNTWIRQLEANI